MKCKVIIFSIVLFSQISGCTGYKKVHFVKDNARVLSGKFVDSLNQEIYDTYLKTKNQVIIYTISSIDSIETLEEYTNDLIKKTDFSKGGFAQSVVIVLYPDEGHVFLRWGEKLKDKIQDSAADSIIDSMKLFFIKGEFDKGINSGVKKIQTLIK